MRVCACVYVCLVLCQDRGVTVFLSGTDVVTLSGSQTDSCGGKMNGLKLKIFCVHVHNVGFRVFSPLLFAGLSCPKQVQGGGVVG